MAASHRQSLPRHAIQLRKILQQAARGSLKHQIRSESSHTYWRVAAERLRSSSLLVLSSTSRAAKAQRAVLWTRSAHCEVTRSESRLLRLSDVLPPRCHPRCDFWLRGSNFANFPIYYVMVKWARAARPYGVGSLRVFYKGLNDLSTWEGLVSRTRRVWSKGIAPDRLAKA